MPTKDEPKRGTGVSSRQMRDAPEAALFIWCNDLLIYPKRLAAAMGRGDLRIVGRRDLKNPERFGGLAYPAVIVDHAMPPLSPLEADSLEKLKLRAGRYLPQGGSHAVAIGPASC